MPGEVVIHLSPMMAGLVRKDPERPTNPGQQSLTSSSHSTNKNSASALKKSPIPNIDPSLSLVCGAMSKGEGKSSARVPNRRSGVERRQVTRRYSLDNLTFSSFNGTSASNDDNMESGVIKGQGIRSVSSVDKVIDVNTDIDNNGNKNTNSLDTLKVRVVKRGSGVRRTGDARIATTAIKVNCVNPDSKYNVSDTTRVGVVRSARVANRANNTNKSSAVTAFKATVSRESLVPPKPILKSSSVPGGLCRQSRPQSRPDGSNVKLQLEDSGNHVTQTPGDSPRFNYKLRTGGDADVKRVTFDDSVCVMTSDGVRRRRHSSPVVMFHGNFQIRQKAP